MPIFGKVARDRACGPVSQLHAESVGEGTCAPALVVWRELPWKGFTGWRLTVDSRICSAVHVPPKITSHVTTGFVIQHDVLVSTAQRTDERVGSTRIATRATGQTAAGNKGTDGFGHLGFGLPKHFHQPHLFGFYCF